jgi:transcriptional regulator with XRE-family HTH domain
MDPSLVSRIENNLRQPTREQLMNIAKLYELDPDALLVDWLSEKIARELKEEALAGRVLQAVVRKLESGNHQL